MNPTLILSVLSALAAAVWSVWTWSEEQQKERQVKRDQEAALYVNSFLSAMEELQSRLYGILEGGELAYYRKEYPDQYESGSPAAIEILYRLSQYYGWAFRTFRYGPYTHDSRLIELTREIGKAWESREYPGDAFRFSFDERASLGQAVVRHVGEVSPVLPVFESLPFYQFAKEISDETHKHAPLYQSKAVRSTLAAIDRADKVEDLEGYERLAVLQNLLVDLLGYIETKEGFSVSIGERRKARIAGGDVRVSSEQPAMARVLHQSRGRIRLGIPRLKSDAEYVKGLQSLLQSVKNVVGVRVNTTTASVVISFNPAVADDEFARTVVNTIEKGFSDD